MSDQPADSAIFYSTSERLEQAKRAQQGEREGRQEANRSRRRLAKTTSTLLARMFGWGKKESPQATAGPSQPAAPSPPPPRTFESLVEEELPIQRHSVAMQGGMPSCMTLFDDFVSCYCACHPSS